MSLISHEVAAGVFSLFWLWDLSKQVMNIHKEHGWVWSIMTCGGSLAAVGYVAYIAAQAYGVEKLIG